MKKFILSSLAVFAAMGLNAQTLINGDVNHDGELTAADLAIIADMITENRVPEMVDYTYRTSYDTNGYDAIDLGLPSGTLWQYLHKPGLYAFGSAKEQTVFDWSNYEYSNDDGTEFYNYNCLLPGRIDWVPVVRHAPNKTYPTSDPATALYGGDWETPTQDQFYELLNNCLFEKVAEAIKVTSTINGAHIWFLPQGTKDGTDMSREGTQASYWSNSTRDSYYTDAYCFSVNTTGTWGRYVASRNRGKGVIGVINKHRDEIAALEFPYTNIYVPVGVEHEINDLIITTQDENRPLYNKTLHFVVEAPADFPVSSNKIKANGKTTSTYITAISTDRNAVKSERVKITRRTTGGYDFVDLGLPSGTLWCTRNIGADEPNRIGELYAWGELSTKSEFTQDNYEQSSYNSSDKYRTLRNADDVAYQVGEKYLRYPTAEEFDELVTGTICTEVTEGAFKYWEFKSKVNNNKIIIPITNFSEGIGQYWTRDVSDTYGIDDYKYVSSYKFAYGKRFSTVAYRRYQGLPIRPVLTTVR